MNRRVLSLAIAGLLIFGVVVTVVMSVANRGPGGGQANGFDPGNCIPVTVTASSEKADLMQAAADRYNAGNSDVDGKCVRVQVISKASGGAESALAAGWNSAADGPPPTAWSPAASTWVKLLESDLKKADRANLVMTGAEFDPVSIVKTPLVLAMPEPAARALGWPDQPIGWRRIAELASSPDGWAAAGHPEWGRFTLGKTSPDLSTSGLAATVGAFVAATGKASDLTPADLSDPAVLKTVKSVEQAAVHYGDTTLTFLTNLQAADDKGKGLTYVSAVAVEEKSVYDYNQGNPDGSLRTKGQHAPPKTKLVAVYPVEGTLWSDNPFVVLNAPWVTPEQQKGAVSFRSFLLTPEIQQLFTEAGFRDADGKPGSALKDSAFVETVSVPQLSAPSGDMLAQVRQVWHQVRKKARVMLVLDVSGSMGEAGSEGTKLDEARKAASEALNLLNPEDEIGLAIFTTNLPGHGNYQTLVPVGPAKKTVPEIRESLDRLVPLNGTPLYSAVRKAATDSQSAADPDRINAVVILTDGRNEAADNNLDQLLVDLAVLTGSESSKPVVRVFTIAYGADGDLVTLQRISEATAAKAYDARKPGTIRDVFTSVVSNF
ncbi:MAG: extracellular solute-binding protein [Candidatus Nanopelagicales bacterium]|nr:extracellular solute-binding protein [Candidatus Nanopelagicales bacterium]